MKRNLRRTITTILTAVLVLTVAPLSGYIGIVFPNFVDIFSIQSEAAIEDISGVYTYIVENGEVTITKCNDTSIETALIPSSFDDNVVTKIDSYAFKGCTQLKNIEIPESVISIGNAAFESCEALEEIVIPDSVVDLGMGIFTDCVNLKNVKLGKGINQISYRMFEGCTSLTHIEIPDTVDFISDRVFRDCINLESVKIPLSVKTIGYLNFEYCYKLKNIYYEGSEKQWNQIGFESYYEDFSNVIVHYNYREDITDVSYSTQEDTHKNFTVTANGRQSMIQFIEPDGGTRTYDRYNKNVSITSYDIEGNVVNAMSRDLAYEVWEIYSNMSVGVEIKVRGKENFVWDSAKYSLTIAPYNPIISIELSAISGKKGPVPATVITDDKTEKIMFKMPNNTSVTISMFTTDENGNRVFTGKAWMNEDGTNEIKVLIRRDKVWKFVGTLEYTVE